MTCLLCGQESDDDDRCSHCGAWLREPPEDPSVGLAQTAVLVALIGVLTFGVGTLIAIPVAIWAFVSSYRRGVQPFRAGTAVLLLMLLGIGLYMIGGFVSMRNRLLGVSDRWPVTRDLGVYHSDLARNPQIEGFICGFLAGAE